MRHTVLLNGLSYFDISLLAKPNDLIKTLFQKPKDFIICHNPNNSNRSMKQILKDKIVFLLPTLINHSVLWSFCRISVTNCFLHPAIYLSASHNVSTLLTSFLCWFCLLLSQTSGLSFEFLVVLQLRNSLCIFPLTLTMHSFHSISSQTLHLVHFCSSQMSLPLFFKLQKQWVGRGYESSLLTQAIISMLTISKSCTFQPFVD